MNAGIFLGLFGGALLLLVGWAVASIRKREDPALLKHLKRNEYEALCKHIWHG